MKYLLLIFFFIGWMAIGLNNEITIQCSGKTLIMSIDHPYKDTVFHDEEGFNRYLYLENGSILEVRCGGLADNQYLRDTTVNEIWKECNTRYDRVVSGIVKTSGNRWIFRKINGTRLSVSGVSEEKEFAELEKIIMSARILDE